MNRAMGHIPTVGVCGQRQATNPQGTFSKPGIRKAATPIFGGAGLGLGFIPVLLTARLSDY